jgi:hypothetical protein
LQKATLNYQIWYELENFFDYAYLEVSTDNGEHWTVLKTEYGTDEDPNRMAYGVGYTGTSGEWLSESVDLSPYAGKMIQIRFEVLTDFTTNRDGLQLDNIEIPELNFFDGAEDEQAGWEAQGFIRSDNLVPARWLAWVVKPGPEIEWIELQPDQSESYEITGFGDKFIFALLVVSPTAPVTTQELSMELYSDISQSQPNPADFLKGIPLFAALDPEGLREISTRLRRRTFAPGVTLFHQDMPGSSLYLIEEGRVRVFILGRTGIEITLNVIGPGDILGELALLDNKPHSATALTLEPCVVWLLARQDMGIRRALPGDHHACLGFWSSGCDAPTHLIEAMAFHDVQGRLGLSILFWLSVTGLYPHGDRNRCTLDAGELASMVGASPGERQCLDGARSSEMIRIDGSHITVNNAEDCRR